MSWKLKITVRSQYEDTTIHLGKTVSHISIFSNSDQVTGSAFDSTLNQISFDLRNQLRLRKFPDGSLDYEVTPAEPCVFVLPPTTIDLSQRDHVA